MSNTKRGVHLCWGINPLPRSIMEMNHEIPKLDESSTPMSTVNNGPVAYKNPCAPSRNGIGENRGALIENDEGEGVMGGLVWENHHHQNRKIPKIPINKNSRKSRAPNFDTPWSTKHGVNSF